MRTTTWQLVRLFWALYRHPNRKYLRIGQLLTSCAGVGIFYIENERLSQDVKKFLQA